MLLVTSSNLHETDRNFLEKYVLDCLYSPLTQITYTLTIPPEFLRNI